MDEPKKSTTISAPVARMSGNKQSKQQTNMSAEEFKKLIAAQLKNKL